MNVVGSTGTDPRAGNPYLLTYLRVPGVMVGWPQTKGTASNERVHSFYGSTKNN